MIIKYEYFVEKLEKHINKLDNDYLRILISMINSPERYISNFRITNVKDKIIQNITQSKEIKFGIFLEEIIFEYLIKSGFNPLTQKLKINQKKYLDIDQLFIKDNIIYFIEQKVRDDHDSTKKEGQFLNFLKKKKELEKIYKNQRIISIMWFIDSFFTKNKNFYSNEISKLASFDVYLFYGKELFEFLNLQEIWDELNSHLEKYKIENTEFELVLPDFNNLTELTKQLSNLSDNLIKKINTNDEKYKKLRKFLFKKEDNIVKKS
ncbi:HpyAIV family type II restriction enzyme [Mycoplasmopsis gallinarum]